MNRQNTIVAGVAAIAVLIVAGLMLAILPQHRAAADARTAKAEIEQSNSLLSAQLAALVKQKRDLDGLNSELGKLRKQIPASADLAGVTRVIVEALKGPGNADVTLESITPQVPAIAFTQREQLTPTIGAPEAVAPAPSGGVEAEAPPEGTFQEIPLAITATAPDVRAAFRFVDRLNNGPRMLGVHHVDIASNATASGGDEKANSVTVSVIGAAFLQPRAQDLTGR